MRFPLALTLISHACRYHNQNFEGGRFCFEQLQLVVDALRAEDEGARILLLLPQKYLLDEIPNHTASSERRTSLTDADRELIASWREEGMLFACVSGLYDDWYWMYASVAEAPRSEAPHSGAPHSGTPHSEVPHSARADAGADAGDAAGRTRVVTNDAMRDHVEGILSPRDFRRWRHSQILGFGIGPPGDDGSPPAASVSAVPTLTV